VLHVEEGGAWDSRTRGVKKETRKDQNREGDARPHSVRKESVGDEQRTKQQQQLSATSPSAHRLAVRWNRSTELAASSTAGQSCARRHASRPLSGHSTPTFIPSSNHFCWEHRHRRHHTSPGLDLLGLPSLHLQLHARAAICAEEVMSGRTG
jgi:hypothetical protein